MTIVEMARMIMLTLLCAMQLMPNGDALLAPLYDDERLTQEYCNGETFRPRCLGGKNDVIVTLRARYGRMSFGRCLKKEPGFSTMMTDPRFITCSDDVKYVIDRHCSGQSECDVRINDQNFDGIESCYAGLKMHLEVSYTCVKVAAENRHCTVPLTTEPQHIVSGGQVQSVDPVGCGTGSQPWSVEAMAGQRIAVSLVNFDHSHNVTSTTPDARCHVTYGSILDRNIRRNITICGHLSSQRSKHYIDEAPTRDIYTSTSNHLHITVNKSADNRFMIRLEAVGCSDLTPPSDAAWLKRVDDQITIGCYMSRQSWHLNCVNGVWTGTVGVCSQAAYEDMPSDDDMIKSASSRTDISHSSSETVLMAAVASAGVALCCLVICVGVVCLHRQKKRLNKQQDGDLRLKDTDRNYNRTNQLQEGLIVQTTFSNNFTNLESGQPLVI